MKPVVKVLVISLIVNIIVFIISLFMGNYMESISHWSTDAWFGLLVTSCVLFWFGLLGIMGLQALFFDYPR